MEKSENQILYVVSLGRGDESLYKWSRSHEQNGRHAHKIFSGTCGQISVKFGM